ncbi:MAG: ABC transporter substrate-binding protein [Bacteroidota bacterium]
MRSNRIAILILLAVMAFSLSCKKEEEKSVTTIKIAGLYSITGNWNSLGKASQEAMKLALIDINAYLELQGSSVRFSTVVYDTRLDTSDAKSSIQSALNNNNVRLVIGPQSSAEVGAVRQYANANGMLVVSQGSTASSLALPDDAVFRFCPGDGPEGEAMCRTMYSAGKRMVITLARNDAGNTGLQHSVNTRFVNQGGQVDALPAYATTTTDFTSIIQQLHTTIQQHVSTYGAGQVAVYIASFDECVDLFRQAASDTVLTSVNWYGGDGMVQSAALLNDAAARDFAIATGFFAPNFGLPSLANPRMEALVDEIRTATGVDPDAYALSVYDAMWVMAKTVANSPGILNDFDRLKATFEQEADQYFGVTGPVLLDANGDRSVGSFDYWGIVEQGGAYSWRVVGRSN